MYKKSDFRSARSPHTIAIREKFASKSEHFGLCEHALIRAGRLNKPKYEVDFFSTYLLVAFAFDHAVHNDLGRYIAAGYHIEDRGRKSRNQSRARF